MAHRTVFGEDEKFEGTIGFKAKSYMTHGIIGLDFDVGKGVCFTAEVISRTLA
jgi:hypothetical protein